MFPMSINFISVLHISLMIPREVDPVEVNLYKKFFYLSFDPSAEDDAETILASFPEMNGTSKIPFPPSPPAPFSLICLHPNQRPSPAHLHASFIFSHIVFAPSASSTSMLV